MTTQKLSVDDPEFVDKIIFEVKSQGHFDAFRKECLADVDLQPAFQNLHSRVEDSVQKFLNRQVWTPETNKNRLREDMRYNIVRAGYLESGVSRIVDQVVEQKMDFIQSKVEEILYQYVGITKPVKKEKNLDEALEVETDLLPTDLEAVSPDSEKKSLTSEAVNMEEIKDEEVEEEIVEDEDFESPAFEPVETMEVDKNEQSQHSNLSAISGLTSQDSAENKTIETPTEVQEQQMQQDTQLSQISSLQDMSQDEVTKGNDEEVKITESTHIETENVEEETPMESTPTEKQEPLPEVPEKSQFDLKKDSIEFTGTERKSMPLDDSTNSGECEKVLQPQDVPPNTMEIENLYENDTTDSSEMRMEIDLKDETTQETQESSKIEESSQDSATVPKEKTRSETKKESNHHHHRSDRSRDKHKSSSSSRKSSHHHRSSSAKSKHDDKSKSRSDNKSRSSSSHKKSSSEKDRSSSSRRDHDKDKKSSKDDSSRSKHREHKKTDDHHQEKSSSRRRRSTDHDSNEGKGELDKAVNIPTDVTGTSEIAVTAEVNADVPPSKENQETTENKLKVVDKMLNENCELFVTSSSPSSSIAAKKEQKSSILVKYDYLKPPKPVELTPVDDEKIEDGFHGFTVEDRKGTENPWFEFMRKRKTKDIKTSNNNFLEPKKLNAEASKSKPKTKSRTSEATGDSPSTLNGNETITAEARAQSIAQQQRYTDDDLYKPRVDFGGNRNRRRRGNSESQVSGVKDTKTIEVTAEASQNNP